MRGSTSPESSEMSTAYSDSGCARNQALEVADGAYCERDEGMHKVHSLLNNSRTSMTSHKNRSVGILRGSEPQEDTSLNFEGYWNPKHPGGIAIKI